MDKTAWTYSSIKQFSGPHFRTNNESKFHKITFQFSVLCEVYIRKSAVNYGHHIEQA